mmetsp:Transcript_29324/g.56993  ORF Transcript_29324/g.56993 Transcript_29324/m.56993 type:complete len:433 (-) Transcript_29324:2002-3300(-)
MRMISLFAMMLTLLSACAGGTFLAAPPNLYLAGKNYPSDLVAGPLRTATPQIFYVTDREREGQGYGAERSPAMAFGAATVQFGTDLSWDELVVRTHVDAGRRISSLTVDRVEEMVKFSSTPLPYERKDGALRHLPASSAQYQQETRAFQDAIRAQIAETGNTRILLYVHGFNNAFSDSVTTLANVWHFSGRGTIPVAFTWPAGAGAGPLGYFRDRDAGTFSVHHAKEFMRMLAAIPEVSDIDIVAHSRGTDVVTTALRELIIFARGQGVHPKIALKTGTFIMAAPDLDIGIVRQRLQAERFSEAFEQINLYINPDDAALRLSAYLTRSRRLGALRSEDFEDGELQLLRKQGLVHFIRVDDVRGGFGHGYFRDNPAVLSDVVLALRTRAFPGGSLRPLEQDESGIWVLYQNYPLERLPELELLLAREQRRDER